MFLTELLLYLDLVMLLYIFGGYALLTIGFNKQSRIVDNTLKPACTLLIPAFNEEKVIAEKIRNSLGLNYPAQLLEIVVVADGSTDRTVDIARSFNRVKVSYQATREGKLAAIQRVMPEIDSAIVVLTDANCFLNPDAIDLLTRHFADNKVGAVSGEKKVLKADSTAGGESFYWRYESWLKERDSDFFSIVGAAGELLAIRKTLYTKLPEDIILDDFVQSMLICGKGLQVVYEPGAVASELPSVSIQDEYTRKVRIAAGGFQAIDFLGKQIDFTNKLKLRFLYYSHRVFRWTLAPFAFFLLLPLNLVIVSAGGGLFFQGLLGLQLLAYGLVLFHSVKPAIGKFIPGLPVIHYVFFMQLTALAGLVRYKTKSQSATWEKIPRF